MTSNSAFFSWQPVLTDHQAFTFQALADEAGIPVVAFVTSMEDAVRKKQGWADTQVCSVERRLIPQHGFLRYCYRQLRKHRTDIHFFASPFEQPRLILAMIFAALLGIEFYLISEPYSPKAEGYLLENWKLLGNLKAALRPWLYRSYALMLRSHAAGIFVISRLSLIQYQHAGVPLTKLFPFGYFVPSDSSLTERPKTPTLAESPNLRIIFVGSLIRRKGIDLLQVAAQRLHTQGCKVTVDIYGPGDVKLITPDCASIKYRGTIPFGQAQSVIAQYDLLVLPSRYDGWGVVVNEALCAGVPVVCSDTSGAGLVAATLGAGLIFNSGDSNSLSDILAHLAAEPSLMRSLRGAASKAARILQPEVAAHYMLDVIRSPADIRVSIPSPWYPDNA